MAVGAVVADADRVDQPLVFIQAKRARGDAQRIGDGVDAAQFTIHRCVPVGHCIASIYPIGNISILWGICPWQTWTDIREGSRR